MVSNILKYGLSLCMFICKMRNTFGSRSY